MRDKGGSMNRRSLRLVLLVLLLGCGRKPPYEGRSVAELERMLDDPSPTVQVQGAYGLGLHGAAARPAIPALIRALGSSNTLVRQQSAIALGQIGAAEARSGARAHDGAARSGMDGSPSGGRGAGADRSTGSRRGGRATALPARSAYAGPQGGRGSTYQNQGKTDRRRTRSSRGWAAMKLLLDTHILLWDISADP